MPVIQVIKKYFSSFFVLIAGVLIVSSCTVVKKYQKDQPFIFENKVNIKGDVVGDKSALKNDLENQIEDTVKARSKKIVFVVTSIKNPPGYDTIPILQSTINMKNLLIGRGYRSANISYDTTMKFAKKGQQRVFVNYKVEPGKVYRIDSVVYDLNDTGMQRIATRFSANSLLKKGDPFDYNVVDQERSRLIEAFHNRGYYKISLDDIYALADSSYSELLDPTLDPFEYIQRLAEVENKKKNPTIDIYIRQRPFLDSTRTLKYHIGNFTVYPDAPSDVNLPTKDTMQTWIGKIRVVSVSKTFSPKFIAKNIELKPDSLYTERNYSRTLNNFNRLGAWQNINIFSVAVDSTQTINYLLKLSPAKKQYFSVDFEGSTLLNSTQINQVGSGKIGLAFNFTLKNRNIGHKAIQLENTLRTGIEFNNFQQILASEVSLSNRLIFPWLISPFPIKNERRLQNVRTIIAVELSNIDRFQFYKLNTINTFIGYEWKPKQNVTWQVKPLNIEATFVKPDSGFYDAIKDYPLLVYSYNDGLVIGMNANYSINFGRVRSNKVRTLRLYAEESGILLGGILSGLTEKGKPLQKLFRFFKLSADYRHYIQLQNSQLAFRGYAGWGIPFKTKASNDVALPFFKSFFAGGPNSMRGWQIRKLGIGQNIYFDTTLNGSFNDKYADVQLEANGEYRFNLFPLYGFWLRGAVFTDVGNIWYRTTKDGKFPKSDLVFGRVFEDLAIASGFGLRVDFKYFVLRFDLGYPIKDPRYGPDKTDTQSLPFYSPNKGGWFVENHWNKGTFQFAIGYPF